MTKDEFQKKHSSEHLAYLTGQAGTNFIRALTSLRPDIAAKPTEHETLINSGIVKGYELAINNIFLLATTPQQPQKRVDPSYPEKK